VKLGQEHRLVEIAQVEADRPRTDAITSDLLRHDALVHFVVEIDVALVVGDFGLTGSVTSINAVDWPPMSANSRFVVESCQPQRSVPVELASALFGRNESSSTLWQEKLLILPSVHGRAWPVSGLSAVQLVSELPVSCGIVAVAEPATSIAAAASASALVDRTRMGNQE